MSSYHGAHGAWDGGPPGAEAEYTERPPVPPYAAPPAAVEPAPRAMPTTDPWTGVSYSHYGAMPAYDYRAYSAAGYPYGYDSSSGYYQQSDGVYYGKFSESTPYQQHLQAVYDCPSSIREHRERTPPPVEPRRDERHRSYRTNSRSVSPYERWQRTSKRDSSYKEETWRVRSRSKSLDRKKYSSSDRSRSRSHSYSRRSPKRDKTKRRYLSDSSPSDASYDKINKNRDPSSHSREKTFSGSSGRSGSCRTHSLSRSISKSRKGEDGKKKKNKSHSSKDKKQRVVSTPPRKRKESLTPPKGHKKSDRLSITPPKSYKKCDRSLTPPRVYKNKDRRSDTPLKTSKDQSLTPPKRYARNSNSKSGSRSPSVRRKRKHSNSSGPSSLNSTSRSRSSSPCQSSRSKSKRTTKRKSQQRSPSKSRSKRHSRTKSRSSSRHPSKSRGKRKRSVSFKGSKSRSRSRSFRSRSRSQTGSGSDDERRGQFTVADRKRFWKLHRNRQEKEKDDGKDVKEVKPPPGAVESTRVDDVHYGDPPEVEGPNFAELLPTADQVLQQASTSKSKSVTIPIKNDGSFLEMFKKMQEETKKAEITEKKPEIKKPVLPFIGKRRGGRVLKTGLVKKAKAIDEQLADNTPKDAWSLYMQEVKKYRETSCEEERKTRPLVK